MLWRFHELHHSQEDMNVLTVFRTHPLIHVSYLIALVPGVVLLANGALSITVLALYGGIVAFAHSNTRLGFGPLGRIFVSPNYHRIHHQLDGPQDVNLGFALAIWDQMFHRAVFPTKDTVSTDTGLPGRPLLVEQAASDRATSAVFAAQLVAPFRAHVQVGRRLPLRLTHVVETSTRSSLVPDDAARDGKPTEPFEDCAVIMVTTSLETPTALVPARWWRSSSPPEPPELRRQLCLAARRASHWPGSSSTTARASYSAAFNGPGIHRTALYFSNTAHLHPGGFFAVLGGLIEFGERHRARTRSRLSPGRRRPLRGHGDGDDHRHLGHRDQLVDIASRLPAEPGTRRPGARRCGLRLRPVQPRRAD